jgi:Na+-driven multidrug efflux pump
MRKALKKIVQLSPYFGGGALLLPAVAFAQLKPPASLKILTLDVFWRTTLCNIAGWAFTFAMVVGVIMAIMAGYKYMTARGDPNKVSEAHRTLTYAAVGIAVALIAVAVPNIVIGLLGSTPTGEVCP